MTFNVVMFFTVIVIVSGQTTEQCTRLSNAYDSICPSQTDSSTVALGQGKPGKRGPAGSKGERGEKGGTGEKGGIGEAEYDRLEELISERVQEARRNYTRKLNKLSKALTETKQELQRDKEKTDFCSIGYKGKCFWFQTDESRMTFERAVEMCAVHRGVPANIYSKFHYSMLWEYLRMFSHDIGWAHAWLGMKYDFKTSKVTLSNGVSAPYLKWYSGYPNILNGCGMTFEAKASRDTAYQHLTNSHHSWTRHGVICEK